MNSTFDFGKQKLQNFVAGQWLDPLSGQWLQRHSPTTGLLQTLVPDSELLDVIKAIQGANHALPNWQKTEPAARAEILIQIAEKLLDHAELWASQFSAETGSPLASQALESVARAIEIFRYNAEVLQNPKPLSVDSQDASSLIHRAPIGLVAAITSWVDAPALLAARVAPALASGNAILLKPSSFAPQTANYFAQLLSTVPGLLPGVFSLVQGRGVKVGQTIVTHPGVSTLTFTGQTETGRGVQMAAAEFLKRTHLALSGCNSIIVFADADLEKTAQKVARLSLTGEVPLSLRAGRIFVQESIYKEFLELFKKEAESVTIGDPVDKTVRLGPLITPQAQERYLGAVEQAMAEKGKLLCGGPEKFRDANFQNGNFVQPTVLFDLNQCSTLQQDEIPGPLALIASFKYQNDAIKLANTSPYGQAIYLFHPDLEKAHKIALKLDAGRIFINPSHLVWDPRLSFGGLRNSGLGIEGGEEGLNFYTKPILISQSRNPSTEPAAL